VAHEVALVAFIHAEFTGQNDTIGILDQYLAGRRCSETPPSQTPAGHP
jgi:hypothetical protein